MSQALIHTAVAITTHLAEALSKPESIGTYDPLGKFAGAARLLEMLNDPGDAAVVRHIVLTASRMTCCNLFASADQQIALEGTSQTVQFAVGGRVIPPAANLYQMFMDAIY